MEKRGFVKYLFTKRYNFLDFLEPLVALPFGLLIVRMLEAQFNITTVIIGFALLFLYLPALIVVFESPRQ